MEHRRRQIGNQQPLPFLVPRVAEIPAERRAAVVCALAELLLSAAKAESRRANQEEPDEQQDHG